MRWDLPAHVVERRIRAVTPNPGAWTMIGDLRVKLGPVTRRPRRPPEPLPPGAIQVDRNERAGRHRLATRAAGPIQPPGKKPMNAADWARGARLDEIGACRHEARTTEPPRPAAPAARASRSTRPAAPRSTCCARSRERDAYANLALPAMLRERGITGRDAAFATELTYGTCRTPGPARRGHRRGRGTLAGQHRPRAARPAAARHLPAAAHPGRRARRGVHHRRTGRHRIRLGASGFRQRRAAHHRRRATRQSWVDELAPRRRHRPDRARRVRARASRGGSPRPSPTRSARTPVNSTRCWPATTNGPQVHLAARPGVLTAAELADAGGRHGRPLFAVRGVPAGR